MLDISEVRYFNISVPHGKDLFFHCSLDVEDYAIELYVCYLLFFYI